MGRNKWYREFETRRNIRLEDENVTWIETDPDFNVEEILPIFKDLGGSRARAGFMEETFGKLRRSHLRSVECSHDANILLDECTFGSQPKYRTSKGPLTPRQLHDSLQRPRFRVSQPTEASPSDEIDVTSRETAVNTHSGAFETETDEQEPNAERRVIYIADPDQWSALALVASASFSQTGPLRNLLYRHFKREAYAGLTTTSGLAMFELAFHLPFWALRLLSDGQKLENSRDVSFLDLEGRESAVVVHSSYSCAVSGVDIWRWVAYCLIDTKHDTLSEDRESAEGHYLDIENCGVPPLSPCGNARFFDPGPEPRLFFLRVLEVRSTMVHDEWTQIVQRLERSVAQYQQVRYPWNCPLLNVSINLSCSRSLLPLQKSSSM